MARAGRETAGIAALGAALSLGGASRATAAELAADAGSLRAQVEAEPWGLELTDADGARVLAEHPGTGAGPDGALGFRTASGWAHATRVVSARRDGGAYVAELATTDPSRGIEVRIASAGEGTVRLEAGLIGSSAGVQAIGMGFRAEPGERYLGFGERSDAVAREAGVVESYVSDGPYQASEYPFLNLFVPPWGLRERTDATYYPIPWLLSTDGYGVLVENPETSYFRLRSGAADAWSVEVVRAPEGEPGGELGPPPDRLALTFFGGPEPAAALKRFTGATGRQPPPSAPWVHGPWYQAGDDEAAELELLRKRDAPLSVLQTYTHYLPCGEQNTARERQRVAAAHSAGVAVTTYFNPMVCADYAAGFQPAAAA